MILKKAGILLPDFIELGISIEMAGILKENGIAVPTPIQQLAIPVVLDGQDIIAQAQTGTGKTLAFVLPIIEKIDTDADRIQALIVTPTRELALQITAELEKLVASMDVSVLAVYGGQDVDKQLKKLAKRVHIVVGTPGRLLDHIRRETVRLGEISFLVLDEADQMLHIGFLNEVEAIIRETPSSRQTMLFSATMPEDVRKLAKKHMRDPQYMQVEKTQGPAETVNQLAVQTTDRGKQGAIMELVRTHRPFMAVIFCRTKRRVGRLHEVLKANGFSCEELHGDLSQSKREQVMKKFRDAEYQLLIATDVAARGLDVEGVTHVFNYDIPEDSESYVHRIGRTGRAGTKGLAITLFTAADRPKLNEIEKELNIRIKKENMEGPKDKSTSDKSVSKPGTGKKTTGKGTLRTSHRTKEPKPAATSGRSQKSDHGRKTAASDSKKQPASRGKQQATTGKTDWGRRAGAKQASSRQTRTQTRGKRK
ncbi:DEAD/DEAH box helicase [Neobacillus sp. YIM B06451]|uniref:DEAD/DEAH box helicase n=1 Tax=Neobacillus sp. YIM B06451 TaxID=3070994 RepID=UPI00292DA678|nr:DEAD/DEAH box helicase [Neobacillus sp. YIM B06451]